MNRNIKSVLPLLAAVLLCGCAGGSGTDPVPDASSAPAESSQSAGTEQSRDAEESTISPQPSGLPLISVQTANTGADALDFLTKPVARHVAEAVASWTPGYVIPPEPYYQDCTVTVSDGSSSFTADAAVKARGNWTTKYAKKPMRLKFADKHNLLGLNSGAEMKNWLLLAEYKDASLLRDRTALRAAEAVLGKDGLYTADPRTNPDAKLVREVRSLTPEILASGGGRGSGLGTGGMATKLAAARICMEHGTNMVICNGAQASVLYDVTEGKDVGTWFIGGNA